MRAAALILAVLLTAVPVTDTGTGTATEYDLPAVTIEQEAAEPASYRQVTQTPAANVSDDHEREADADQQVSFDEQGYLSFCTWREIEMLACLIDWEIGGGTRNEKAAIAWEVLNRIDSTDYDFRNIHTVSQALYQPGQYYSSYAVGSQESTEIVIEVLTLYMMEQQSGYPIEGRVLPREYRWHLGDGKHNNFEDRWPFGTGNVWDWRWTGGY